MRLFLILHLKKTVRSLPFLSAGLFAVLLLVRPSLAASGIQRGLSLCYSAIIPSLFPFLFIVDYLFSRLAARAGGSRGGQIAAAIGFALCGGFPMGAKALGDLTDRGRLSAKQASILLAGCVNAGPAFLISGVGAGMFGSPRAGLLLFVALSGASLAMLALSIPFLMRADAPPHKKKSAQPALSFGFSASLRYALDATLTLCGYVIFFSCIGGFITAAADSLHISVFWTAVVTALCEVSGGCAAAASIGSVDGLLLAGGAVSLCSISIIMQIRSFAEKSSLSLDPFFLSRLVHLPLTLLFLRSLVALFPTTSDAFAPIIQARLYSLSPLFSVFFMLVAVVLVLTEPRRRKAA